MTQPKRPAAGVNGTTMPSASFGSFIYRPEEEEQTQLLQTALRMIEGYNKWNIDAIMEPRAPSCTQRTFPTRLGRLYLNNHEYREHFKLLMPYFRNFHMDVMDVTEDQHRNKVMVHVKTKADTVVGPYAIESLFQFQMTDDQQHVLSVKEFVDSGYSEEFFPRLKAHVAKKSSSPGLLRQPSFT